VKTSDGRPRSAQPGNSSQKGCTCPTWPLHPQSRPSTPKRPTRSHYRKQRRGQRLRRLPRLATAAAQMVVHLTTRLLRVHFAIEGEAHFGGRRRATTQLEKASVKEATPRNGTLVLHQRPTRRPASRGGHQPAESRRDQTIFGARPVRDRRVQLQPVRTATHGSLHHLLLPP